jgi:hypothetical protein
MMTRYPPDRLPLVIGVTGHRDPRDEDIPRLELAVASIITGLRRDFLNNSEETPIIVLSALAEGSDRLVARVALAHGAQLIAPLPMPLAEYQRDFEPGLRPGNMTEFDELFAQAIAAPVMPLRGGSVEELRTDKDKRDAQYRELGIFIAQSCHVLLALWDGSEKDMSPGGAAEVVTFKRDGIPLKLSRSPRASLDASEIGPVIEVLMPRMKDADSPAGVAIRPWGKEIVKRYRGGIIRRSWRAAKASVAHFFRRELEDQRFNLPAAERRELETWESFEALIELSRHFNCDAASLMRSPDGPARVTQSFDSLFSVANSASVDDVNAKQHAMDVAPMWCRLHTIADALSQERQREFRRDWGVLFLGGLIAFFCFALFAHAGPDAGPHVTIALLSAYFLAFVVMVIVFAHAVRARHQERYLDYRALAEALRVAVFWKILGIGSRYVDATTSTGDDPGIDINPVEAIANAYPIQQPSELAWVKMCLRTLERLDKPQTRPLQGIDPTGHAIASRFWIHGQFDYYKRQGLRHNERAESIETHSTALLVLSPFILVPVLLYLLAFKAEYHWFGIDVEKAVIILIGVLPGIAAALTGYSERLAFKAQARQYDRMRMLFERACNLLPQKINEETMPLALALYHELGAEAMKENAEWVAIYRQRPIRPLQ